jgi:hypothetical protein
MTSKSSKNHEKCKPGRFKQHFGRKLGSGMQEGTQKVSVLSTFWTPFGTTWLIWGAILGQLDFEGDAESRPFSKNQHKRRKSEVRESTLKKHENSMKNQWEEVMLQEA